MADNPFNALLDPEKQGTISGFIGGLMGSPTKSQAAGSATGQALKELSDLRAEGLPPQQALVKFLQSPTGMDYFTQAGPEGLKTLTGALTASTPPLPTLQNVAPGGMLMSQDPNTGAVSNVASNPTTEQKNFASYVTIAKLPQAKIQELAALHADPTAKVKESDAKVAVDNLVNNFGMDPKVGAGILAGTVKVLPIKDQYGQDTGDVSVVDLGTNSVTRLSPGQKGPGSTAPTNSAVNSGDQPPPVARAGATPDTGAKTGIIPATKTDPTADNPYFGKKADMFLGAGVAPSLLGGASKIAEQVDPKLIIPEGAKSLDRQNQVTQLRSALSGMANMGEGLSVNKEVIKGFLDLAPGSGVTTSPHESVSKGIRLLQNVQSEIAAEEAKTTRNDLPKEERVAAAKRMEGWRRVERNLPSMEEMRDLEKNIREGTAGALTPRAAANAAVAGGKKAVTSATDQASGAAADSGITAPVKGNAIDSMAPAELLAVDPRSLSREDQVRLLRRIDALTKGAKNGKSR